MPSAAASQLGRPIQLTVSEAIAATPAKANGHQGFFGSSVVAASWPPASGSSGWKPSERTASRIGSSAFGACTTVSTRCIRLNSMLLTAAIPSSFLRISASSVGQSICMMRIEVRTPSATTSDATRPPKAIGAGEQHEASPWL